MERGCYPRNPCKWLPQPWKIATFNVGASPSWLFETLPWPFISGATAFSSGCTLETGTGPERREPREMGAQAPGQRFASPGVGHCL